MKPFEPPFLGAAYYPEAWPLEQIDEDITLMKRAGLNVARIGEFAWNRMEPQEGEYDFEWLHLVVEKLGRAGIATIMGTPTATPPAWLVERFPEVLVVYDTGVRTQHGARRHACPNSPVYRDHCERIVTRLGREFGKHEYIIGWQIDNELYPGKARGCCCPVCHRKFQDAMRRKFGSIHTLNDAWGTNLWSMTYQSFAQLPIPRADTWHHPSLLTAWMQFQSDSYVEFCEHQSDLLHQLVDQPIGTDMMPFHGLDYHKIHRTLDLVQFNHYNTSANLWSAAFWMNLCRPIKDVPWWNTETSTCWSGGNVARGYADPDFCRANSWLAFALGAEANLYWLWRAHWSGQELMHGSVVTTEGRPMYIFEKVREISAGLGKCSDFLNKTRPVRTGLAIHCSTFAYNLFTFLPMVDDFKYSENLNNRYAKLLLDEHLHMDVIDPASSLEPYRMLCSPFLPSLEDAGLADRLREWIEAGGIWIAGPMTDIRTSNATKYTHAPYGYLEDWAGIRGKYQLPGNPKDFNLRWADGTIAQGSVWYDSFELNGAEALAVYTEGPLEGQPAVTRCGLGKGQIVVLGTLPRKDELTRLILELAQEADINPTVQASPNVLAVPRAGHNMQGMILIEMKNERGAIELPFPATDLLSGKHMEGEISIEPHGVLVLSW